MILPSSEPKRIFRVHFSVYRILNVSYNDLDDFEQYDSFDTHENHDDLGH